MKRIAFFLIVMVANTAYAQSCESDSTFEILCNVAIGSTTAPHPLTVFGATTRSQVRVTNNASAGVLSFLGYARDNVSIGFDVDYDGIWIARDETVGWLYKNADHLSLVGSGNNTVGSEAGQHEWFQVNLTNGASRFLNAAQTVTTIDGGRVTTARIGVNSPDPVAELEVVGRNILLRHASLSTAYLADAPANQSAAMVFRNNGTDSGYITREANTADMVYGAGNAERLRMSALTGTVTTTGSVGIGGAASTTERLLVHAVGGSGIAINNGGSNLARIHTAVPDWLGVTINARHSPSGVWVLDDANKPGWMLNFDNRAGQDTMQVHRIAAGTSNTVRLMTLTANGDFSVSGNLGAKFQDVAEWVPATTPLAAGTVVVLNIDRSNEVKASSTPYDTAVAGVVSSQPGLILGEKGAKKEMIATTGRVQVRVDATARPIKVGDLLVTSEKPGMAMASTPVDVGGVNMHRPGTIIGKALEPLMSGEGEILVLLSLQ